MLSTSPLHYQLVLRLNCQKDLDMDVDFCCSLLLNSLRCFFLVSVFSSEVSDLGSGRWMILGFLIGVDKIFPLDKSSSKSVRLEMVQESKSKVGDRRNWYDQLGSDWIEIIIDIMGDGDSWAYRNFGSKANIDNHGWIGFWMENCCKKKKGLIKWVEGFNFIFAPDNDESVDGASAIDKRGKRQRSIQEASILPIKSK